MSTAATTTVAPLALIFTLNDGLIVRAFEGISDADLSRRVTDRSNSLLWICAHAVTTRALLLKQLGEAYDTGWGERFRRGASFDPHAHPSRDEVLRVHGEVSERLKGALARLDERQLSAPAAPPNPPGVNTIAEKIAFIALHDSYHVGQMAFIRKALGYPQLVG